MVHGGDIYSIYEANPAAKDWLVDFSANISPLGLPEAVRRAVIDELFGAVHYPDPKARRLKGAISEFIEKLYGHCLPAPWIVCGNGAADIIFRFALAMRPSRALLCAPTFGEYEEALLSVQTAVEYYFYPSTTLNGDASILDAIHPGLDAMFICNPNNPTGLLLDSALLLRIVEKTRACGVFLVIDECFLDFVEDECERSVIPLLSHNKHILVLKSFTKMYAMAGLRLGYGLCSDEAVTAAMEKCSQPWPVSSAAESAGVAALKDTSYPRRVSRYVAGERRFLMEAMGALGIHFFDSHANYILLEILTVPDFYEQMLDRGILVRRCGNYRNLNDCFYRVAVNSHENNVRLVEALKGVIKGG